jgi:hypothetical protein
VLYAQYHRKHKGVVRSSFDPDPSDGLFFGAQPFSRLQQFVLYSLAKMLRSGVNGQSQAISPRMEFWPWTGRYVQSVAKFVRC